jgi:hypothetical protein
MVLLCAAVSVGVAVPASADTWMTQMTPGPSGPPNAALTSVSCVSSTFCMAVGTSDYGFDRFDTLLGPIATFAERWDGSAWTILPTPAVSGSPRLVSLSCASSTFCVAVGSTETDGGRNTHALLETWDGTAWTSQATPLGSARSGALSGVSCASSSFCFAVGTSGLSWNGTSWRQITLPSVRYRSSLAAIACVAADDCTAVGYYNTRRIGVGIPVPLAARWRGGRWTVARPPPERYRYHGKLYRNDTRLTAISCPSRSSCLATGLGQRTQNIFPDGGFADVWRDNHWSAAAAGIAHYSPLYGVACVAQDDCYAAGQYDPRTLTPPATQRPMIEHWAAGHWVQVPIPRVATLPNQVWKADNLRDPKLFGISCVPQTGCTAVGAQPQDSASATLAMRDVLAPRPGG